MGKPTFTKHDLIQELCERYKKYGVTVANARRMVDGVFQLLTHAIIEGRKVEVRNFGVFRVVERAARVARNPRTGSRIQVPPRKGIKFAAGRAMALRLRNPTLPPQSTPHSGGPTP